MSSSRCQTPIAVGPEALSARSGDFIAAGTQRFDRATEVLGPLTFSAEVAHASAVAVAARSDRETPPLTIAWHAESASGTSLGGGRAALTGWPSQHVQLALPPDSAVLVFRLGNSGASDVGFNTISVTTTHVAAPPPSPPSSCTTAEADIPLLVALAGAVWHRRLRRSPR